MPSAESVPSTSLAAIQDPKTNLITACERETPTPSPTQVLVKVTHAGVCASDLHLARKDLPYLQPTVSIGGHEGVGNIVALGDDVKGDWQIGDKVAVRWLHYVCKGTTTDANGNTCEPCTTGYENLCPSRKVTGKDIEGCFAQYAVADSRYLVRIPPNVSDAEAAPILCAGVTVYKALKISQLKEGSWVAVAGAGGGLGHLAIQYAKAMGYKPLALDAGKKEICMELGAEAYVDIMETKDCVKDVQDITGGGAHGALICASSARAYADAVKYLRRAGTLICIGLPPKPSPIPVLPEDFIARGIRIMGTSTGTLPDTVEALEFLARGQIKPRIEVRGLGDVEEVLKEIEGAKVNGRIVIKM
ncbi:GroES-like protein [Saitoella complicata NRRL Y-17804]|uniref:Enoyl reductase (ER) domain-containing protein n=1 Tax=Saitoella complicata (strain BCRC 22490 / CBS 7301 / JCM 7358 / NBRC 10748 / NRRL Y-17804) TaxID=698492 RepID=A0A0E9NQ57_SAICN|nr:GroES-like protein [Saitoella complicata NRRL Y-17804]ODQ54693.1 GroES-like protein [Saitoella complicata NRRL Y-17804]GAO51923.1 hypothetical protein G7K_6011-t1 [Saitoella complicata NRRL Y-17804]